MSATDRAYRFAKERILDGRFPGGELISEGDVAAGVSLSRTPVREAFLRLEAEGLLRLYPKRGALVVPVSAGEMESVLETRVVVERFAFEKVIRDAIDLGGAPEEAIARQEERAAAGDAPGFVDADRAFHRVFVAAAGNPILLALHDSLRDRQARMGLAALARGPHRTQQILLEHRALADAVLAGDEEAAHRLVGEHLGATLALLRGGPVA
ncbi:MAG: Transcriptional regulator, GntR family [uncultured Solirubrobacteraceae bacterium]|uniref:Transcriptional regulator, GntR family n=1 Tax=uncultured Solirubrobacteraceae bacterium TaxID=1162706 RepID=A0A6J4S060_9ACTN|nr:MAG: Transcriptional regulator, GntR family [uncultured Solirubrobacteraceae bacterium]